MVYKSTMAMKARRLRLLAVLYCVFHMSMHQVQVLSEEITHVGQEFILGFIENRVLASYPVIRVYVTSLSDEPVKVNISMPLLKPDEVSSYNLESRHVLSHDFPYDLHMQGDGDGLKGILIVTTGDVTVQAGSINDLSSETFLALPSHVLDTSYYVMTYLYESKDSRHAQGPTQFGIVGIHDNTRVTINFPGNVTKYGTRIMTTTMDRFMTYQLQSEFDLTGTHISSNRPIGVYSGTVWTSVGAEFMGDHLVEQLPPVSSWGIEYIIGPIYTRTGGDILRILANDNKTTVQITDESKEDVSFITLNEAEFVDIYSSSTAVYHVLSNRPILLGQFCKSYSADDNRNSDPFMTLIPHVSQWLSAYSFSTFDAFTDLNVFEHYVNIIVSCPDMTLVRLDNEIIANHFFLRNWTEFNDVTYSVATINIPQGYHSLSIEGVNKTFGGILYGFKFQESHGHPLGMGMEGSRTSCVRLKMIPGDLFDNDCDGLQDEELDDGIDNDGDGLIDEDLELRIMSTVGSNDRYTRLASEDVTSYPNAEIIVSISSANEKRITFSQTEMNQHETTYAQIQGYMKNTRGTNELQFPTSQMSTGEVDMLDTTHDINRGSVKMTTHHDQDLTTVMEISRESNGGDNNFHYSTIEPGRSTVHPHLISMSLDLKSTSSHQLVSKNPGVTLEDPDVTSTRPHITTSNAGLTTVSSDMMSQITQITSSDTTALSWYMWYLLYGTKTTSDEDANKITLGTAKDTRIQTAEHITETVTSTMLKFTATDHQYTDDDYPTTVTELDVSLTSQFSRDNLVIEGSGTALVHAVGDTITEPSSMGDLTTASKNEIAFTVIEQTATLDYHTTLEISRDGDTTVNSQSTISSSISNANLPPGKLEGSTLNDEDGQFYVQSTFPSDSKKLSTNGSETDSDATSAAYIRDLMSTKSGVSSSDSNFGDSSLSYYLYLSENESSTLVYGEYSSVVAGVEADDELEDEGMGYETLLMIIIPIIILVGVPICVCCLMICCSCLAKFKLKKAPKEQKPRKTYIKPKVKPQTFSTAEYQQAQFVSHTILVHDCTDAWIVTDNSRTEGKQAMSKNAEKYQAQKDIPTENGIAQSSHERENDDVVGRIDAPGMLAGNVEVQKVEIVEECQKTNRWAYFPDQINTMKTGMIDSKKGSLLLNAFSKVGDADLHIPKYERNDIQPPNSQMKVTYPQLFVDTVRNSIRERTTARTPGLVSQTNHNLVIELQAKYNNILIKKFRNGNTDTKTASQKVRVSEFMPRTYPSVSTGQSCFSGMSTITNSTIISLPFDNSRSLDIDRVDMDTLEIIK